MTTNHFSVSKHEAGTRLDSLLSHRFEDHSRTYFQGLIEEGYVLINGHPVKKRIRPEIGDQVEVVFQASSILDVQPEDIPLDILFEDEHMIVVNKPKGMVVHPAPGAPSGTFANALLHHCKEIEVSDFDELRPGIVHRLDKDTTGVLVAAKTRKAHTALSEQFASRKVCKTYLAITIGKPLEGRFSAPIARHKGDRKKMAVCEDGKEAITEFKVLGMWENLYLVEAKLITGRTHQIRVHLKELNAPILGDPIYGSSSMNRKFLQESQLLHAHTLELTHPLSGNPKKFVASPKKIMKNFIDRIT